MAKYLDLTGLEHFRDKLRTWLGFNDSNVLQASNGGTGQTSLQATRNAMGLGDTTGALPVANGGTGATNAAAARTALMVPALGDAEDSAIIYSDPSYDQRVFVRVDRDNLKYGTIAADSYFGLYNFANPGWVWQLQPNAAVNGLFQSGRGTISDLSRDTLYNSPPAPT